MSTFLIYILKSTASLGVFYLLFRLLMRRETNFALVRSLMLTLVIASAIVPLVQLPSAWQVPLTIELAPKNSPVLPQSLVNPVEQVQAPVLAGESTPASQPVSVPVSSASGFSLNLAEVFLLVYAAGVAFFLLILARHIASVLLIFRQSTYTRMNGYRLYITDRETPSFAFRRSVVISRADYEQHGEAILAHEQAHIRLNHFFDLVLVELVRAFHWFNPAAHLLVSDLKAVHEFQADAETLKTGVDSTNYQLLIIQKGVGPQRFALANSFNHCQIKKRIAMMNKLKTTKAGWWKAAAFLPVLALLLMAFGRTGENAPPDKSLLPSEVITNSTDSVKNWTEADFEMLSTNGVDKPKLDGKKIVNVLINAKSEIMIGGVRCEVADVPNRIRRLGDFSFADDKSLFRKININGKEQMASSVGIVVHKLDATNNEHYLKLLNSIRNTTLEIREKYANEIFGKTYQKIDTDQRSEIDKLMPFIAVSKQIAPPPPPPPPAKKEKVNALPPPPARKENVKTLPPPPPPPPNKDTHIISIESENQLKYNGGEISMDKLEKKIKSEIHENPKLGYYIHVENGNVDVRLVEIQRILNDNGNPIVRFFSSYYQDKGIHSENQYWEKIRLKPLENK